LAAKKKPGAFRNFFEKFRPEMNIPLDRVIEMDYKLKITNAARPAFKTPQQDYAYLSNYH
jgi:hypothetical protein